MFGSGCNPCRSPCTNGSRYAPSNKAHGKANAKQKLPVRKPSWVNCGPCITPTSASRRYELREDPVTLESCLQKCGKCGQWVPCTKCRVCGKFELVGRCDACEEVPRNDKIPTAAISEEVLQKCKICGKFGTSDQCDSCNQLKNKSPCAICGSGDNKCSQCGACTRCILCSQCGSCGQCGFCSHCASCGQFGQCGQYGQCGTSQNVSCGQCDPWSQCVQCAQFANAGRFIPCLTNCSYCRPQNPYNQFGFCQQCATEAHFAPNSQFVQSGQYIPCVPYGTWLPCDLCDPRVPVNHYGQFGQYNQCVPPGLSIPICPRVYNPHPGSSTQPSCPPPNPSPPCGSNNASSSDVPLAPKVSSRPCNTIPDNKNNDFCPPNPCTEFSKPQCSSGPPVITIYAQRTYLDTSGSFQ